MIEDANDLLKERIIKIVQGYWSKEENIIESEIDELDEINKVQMKILRVLLRTS